MTTYIIVHVVSIMCLPLFCFSFVIAIACNCSICWSQNNCRLTYNANESTGFYAVAIQVEDFISSSSTIPMSSVPVQFLVHIKEITIPPDVTAPAFVGTTPADGACITVGSTYTEQITARSGGDSAL